MSDIIDQANDFADADTARRVAELRARAQEILPGAPGECDLCGEWSCRLVDGHCAPCRDRYRLP